MVVVGGGEFVENTPNTEAIMKEIMRKRVDPVNTVFLDKVLNGPYIVSLVDNNGTIRIEEEIVNRKQSIDSFNELVNKLSSPSAIMA